MSNERSRCGNWNLWMLLHLCHCLWCCRMHFGGSNLTLKKEMQCNMEHPVITKGDPSSSGLSQQRSKKTHVLQDKIYFDFKSRFHGTLNPLSYLWDFVHQRKSPSWGWRSVVIGTQYPAWGIPRFFLAPPTNTWIVLQLRHRPLLSKSFLIHHSCINLWGTR
jgi:hypothetical protein